MEPLRRAHRLTCLLLAWFALSVGVAVAAPVLKPQAVDMVCTGSGAMQLMAVDDNGDAADPAGHQHDCRLCVMVGAPPAPLVFAAHAMPAEAPEVVAAVAAPSQAAASFQPRGPPRF